MKTSNKVVQLYNVLKLSTLPLHTPLSQRGLFVPIHVGLVPHLQTPSSASQCSPASSPEQSREQAESPSVPWRSFTTVSFGVKVFEGVSKI